MRQGCRSARQGLLCKVIFEPRHEERREKNISSRGNSKCKGTGAGCAWHVPETVKRPVWMEQSEPEGEWCEMKGDR